MNHLLPKISNDTPQQPWYDILCDELICVSRKDI